ncbi:MAG TPA: aminotransferase class I/II-fold pyridoxal phosphate-dependent enzyme, partial [Marmoricola sp.]|nr:aminotransferase class I/II-fold pyridoxal phosphate-dependent enzyme [Marmoricola sp.]
LVATSAHQYCPDAEITIIAGATQAILTAILAIVHPGDEVIVLDPCYDSYVPNIELAGGKAVRVSLTPGSFRPDFGKISAALTPRTRALIINSPHNPSATVWSAQDMQTLQELLAPTDVLAQQHLRSMSTMLGDLAAAGMLGGAEVSTRLTLLTGSLGAKARRQALLDAASGEAGIVIGTHALLEEHVSFADLGLVVVDEQHRFGVEQRAALGVKADKPPHVLVMTATPIPRTVAMTVFGDLDTSTLSQLPAGRAEVQTNVVPLRTQPGWLPRVWERIREEVATGRQAYVVCSRIDSTDDETDGLWGVVELAEELGEDQLKGLRVEVLHGRLPAETKDAVMLAFAAGEIDVLVSTTVIEVGVDVPNASVMAIMDADRFGVSQLHQLRGRIGRGGHAGVCLLVTRAEPGTTTMQRLEAVASTRDGFALSRIDLEQRREGDVLGTAQSGGAKSLKKLSVLNDEDIIVAAREAATSYVRTDATLAGLPDLADAVAKLEASQRADFMEMG